MKDGRGEPASHAAEEPVRVENVTRLRAISTAARTERDVREHRGGGDADLGVRRVKQRFGDQDIRALTDELRGQAHRNIGRKGEILEIDGPCRPSARYFAGQSGDEVVRLVDLLFELRHERFGRRHLRLDGEDVREGNGAAVRLSLGDAKLLFFEFDRRARGGDLRPVSGLRNDRIDDVSAEHHACASEDVALGFHLRCERFDLPAFASPNIDRVAHRSGDGVESEVRGRLIQAEPQRRCSLIARPRLSIDLREERAVAGPHRVSTAPQARPCGLQAVILDERAGDDRVDGSRSEEMPPVARHLAPEEEPLRLIGAHGCRRLPAGSVLLDLGGLRPFEIRADGASGKRDRGPDGASAERERAERRAIRHFSPMYTSTS